MKSRFEHFGECVGLGFLGLGIGVILLVTLPMTLPLYLIGRFVVAPLVDDVLETQ